MSAAASRNAREVWIGLALIVGGVALIGIESFVAAGLGYWRSDLCFLAAAACWALFTVACRAWRVKPTQAAVIVYTLSMFAYLPVYALLATPKLSQIPVGELVFQAAYQGFFATVVSMFAYTRAVAILGAATTIMTTAVPGIVTLSAAPLLSEPPSALALAGIALVTMGMVTTVLTLRPAPAQG